MNRTILIFILAIGTLTWLGYTGVSTWFDHMHPLPVYGHEDHEVADFTLLNQQNTWVDSRTHRDKIWIVNYFFTSCPTICPKVMRTMQSVHNVVRNDPSVVMMSITVDPKHDTPERMMKYLERLHLNHENWHLLTGEKQELYRLARKSFLVSASEGPGDEHDFIHSENVVILDQDKKIRAMIPGTDEKADEKILKVVNKLKSRK